MFKESGLLNLKYINVYLVGKFMYNVYHEKDPDVFEGFFVYKEHNTRTPFNLHVPPNDSNLCQTGIRYQGVIVWNPILNAKLNIDCSEESFKEMLKKSIQLKLIKEWSYFIVYAWFPLGSWSIIHAITVSLNCKGSASLTYTDMWKISVAPCTSCTSALVILIYETIVYQIRGPKIPKGFLAPFCHLVLYYADSIKWTWT